MEYYAVTDHCDLDYNYIPEYFFMKRLKPSKYMAAVSEFAEQYPFLAMGIELGYSTDSANDYLALPLEKFDYILNSTHTVGNKDCYFQPYFKDSDKKDAYTRYLDAVRESLEAPYLYHAVSHIGYVAKNAPYPDPAFRYSDYPEVLDDILKRIIALDKCLELNTHTKGRGFMPDPETLKRYTTLGGNKISYASDAHITTRIGENYGAACELVKGLGIEHWTVYRSGLPVQIKIE